MKLSPQLEQLRKNGFRITRVRRSMNDIFLLSKRPISADNILALLKKRRIVVNKTTVYRELEFLLEQKLILELHFTSSKTHYEWKKLHHHHVVCKKCFSVHDVDAGEVEKIFSRLERSLARKTRYTQLSHSLEFFGLCRRCSRS